MNGDKIYTSSNTYNVVAPEVELKPQHNETQSSIVKEDVLSERMPELTNNDIIDIETSSNLENVEVFQVDKGNIDEKIEFGNEESSSSFTESTSTSEILSPRLLARESSWMFLSNEDSVQVQYFNLLCKISCHSSFNL